MEIVSDTVADVRISDPPASATHWCCVRGPLPLTAAASPWRWSSRSRHLGCAGNGGWTASVYSWRPTRGWRGWSLREHNSTRVNATSEPRQDVVNQSEKLRWQTMGPQQAARGANKDAEKQKKSWTTRTGWTGAKKMKGKWIIRRSCRLHLTNYIHQSRKSERSNWLKPAEQVSEVERSEEEGLIPTTLFIKNKHKTKNSNWIFQTVKCRMSCH